MKRLHRVLLLFVSLSLAGALTVWLLRMELLPMLLYFFAQRYDIDRIRYEAAEWGRPGAISFYNLQVERGGWVLAVDTLSIRFGAGLSIESGTGFLEKKERYLSPVSLTTGELEHLPLDRINRILRYLNHIDTLVWRRLILPARMDASMHKRGDSLFLTLWNENYTIPIRMIIRDDTIAFSSTCGSLRTENGSYMSWDTISGGIQVADETLSMTLTGRELQLFHRRIASRPLRYALAGLHLQGHTRTDSLLVEACLRDLPLEACLRFSAPLSLDSFRITLEIPKQPHAAYLEAFPEGFFTCLHRAELTGTSALQIDFQYNPALPDTLTLSIDWEPEGFGIRRWSGELSPLVLQRSFTYRPYRSTRTLQIGTESPTYLSYPEITPYVLHAVLHSEDGLFFYHQGFQKEAFLKAMLDNWRCRCFRRGAGTITMQLVRNLLLTREKTLARKVEEILLTALIERFRLLSKQRIAELYLNIVEWGPEVYGLVEAARFYFRKEPHELTIPEAIFLGVLLPSPKAYRYFIDTRTGCAASSLRPHFQKIAYFLERQHYLHPDSVETIQPERACLRAPAWIPPDTLIP